MIVIGRGNISLVKYVTSMRPSARSRLDASPCLGFLHLMNLRYKTLLRAKMSNNQELWTECRSLRNRVTHEVRVAKSRFYVDLFYEVKDCKSYWNLVKKAAYGSAS